MILKKCTSSGTFVSLFIDILLIHFCITKKEKKKAFSEIDFIATKIDTIEKCNLSIIFTGERTPTSLQAR